MGRSGYKGVRQRLGRKNCSKKLGLCTFLKNFFKVRSKELIKLLWSESSTARLAASTKLVQTFDKTTANEVIKIASGSSAPLHSRVAAIFTFKQILGNEAAPKLSGLIKDQNIREWVIRALTDRKTQLQGVKKKC